MSDSATLGTAENLAPQGQEKLGQLLDFYAQAVLVRGYGTRREQVEAARVAITLEFDSLQKQVDDLQRQLKKLGHAEDPFSAETKNEGVFDFSKFSNNDKKRGG